MRQFKSTVPLSLLLVGLSLTACKETPTALRSTDSGAGNAFLATAPPSAPPPAAAIPLADVKAYGAKGDGVTDDTQAIQRALNENTAVYFSKPPVTYRVRGLVLNSGQTLVGPGKWVPCLQGLGTDTVLRAGSYPVTSPSARLITIQELRVENRDFPAVALYNSPDFSITRSYLVSTNTNALELRLSYRGIIRENVIGQSGSGWAISLMDNGNAVTIADNKITGGTAGNGLDIGRSQAVRVVGNVMEVGGGYGIRVAGNPDATFGGISSAVEISANYLEQVKTPISIGEYFVGRAITVSNNYVGNESRNVVAARTGFLVLGRADNITVENNSYRGGGEEPFLVLRHFASGGVVDHLINSRIGHNDYSGVSQNYSLLDFPHDFPISRLVATSELKFRAGVSYGQAKEYISPVLKSNEAINPVAFAVTDLAGQVTRIEVIDAFGAVDTTIQVGTDSNVAEIANRSIASLSYQFGMAQIPLTSPVIRSNKTAVYKVIPGRGAGTFRLRISYRI